MGRFRGSAHHDARPLLTRAARLGSTLDLPLTPACPTTLIGQELGMADGRGHARHLTDCFRWHAQGESNPCFRRERATSWTARR